MDRLSEGLSYGAVFMDGKILKTVKVAENQKSLLCGSMSHWKTVLKSNGEVLLNTLFIVEVQFHFLNNDLKEIIQT